MLVKLPAIHDTPDLATMMDDDFRLFLGDGQAYDDELAEIVHRERATRDFDRPPMRAWLKRAWQMEGTVTFIKEAMATGTSFEEARATAWLANWAKAEGLSTEDAIRRMTEAAESRSPMPWERP